MNSRSQTLCNAMNGLSAVVRVTALAATLLLAGCTAFSGSHLVPGKSTAAEVEATMGAPRYQVAVAGGVTRWFYPRGPMGQETYAVNIGSDGMVQGVEQTLTYENVAKIRAASVITGKDILAMIGPPNKITRFEGKGRDAWEYRMYYIDWKVLTLELSDDGVVRAVMLDDDPSHNVPSGGECARC
jgi:hypothetical protein